MSVQESSNSFPGFKRVHEDPESFPNIPSKVVCIEEPGEWVTRANFKVNIGKNREKELYVGFRSPPTIESVSQVYVDIRIYETVEFKSTGMGITLRQSELDDFQASLLKFTTNKSKKTFGGDGRIITMELKSGTNREKFKYIMFELTVDKADNEKKTYRFCIPYEEMCEFHITLRKISRILDNLKEIETDHEMVAEAKSKGLMVYLACLIHFYFMEEDYPGQIAEKIEGNLDYITEKWKLLAPLFGMVKTEQEIRQEIHEKTTMAIELAKSDEPPEVSVHLVEAIIELINDGKWKLK